MQLRTSNLILQPAVPFRTAKATRERVERICVELEHDGIVGYGEAAPTDTYDQTTESSRAAIAKIAMRLPDDPHLVETATNRLLAVFNDEWAAVSAIDAALHDWIGKRHDVPVHKWLGLDASTYPATSISIGIADPETMLERVRTYSDFPILKLKVGEPNDEYVLRLIREAAPEKTIRVDANGGWSLEQALERIPRLVEYGVELVEQPVGADDLNALRRVKEAGFCPIIADESCVRPADVFRLVGVVDGINVKLSKCGGIRQTLKMINMARAVGLKVMIGCMIESSLGIAAAAQLAPLADWLDLDGHLLLREDPFEGIGGAGGRLTLSNRPGLGVSRRASSVS